MSNALRWQKSAELQSFASAQQEDGLSCKSDIARPAGSDLPYRRHSSSSNPVKGENVLLGRLDAAAEEAAPLVTRAVA